MLSKPVPQETESKDDDNNHPDGLARPSGKPIADASEKCTNHGNLILDATFTPADIHYPNDLSLLNEAHEKMEEIIDTLHAPLRGNIKKPKNIPPKG
ncbi:MAG: hypothetical protein JG767_1750 [Deferribacteraceae bacterium]|nr:hypothetical protein [Deferribacteraceae bacterium]